MCVPQISWYYIDICEIITKFADIQKTNCTLTLWECGGVEHWK